MSWAAFACAQGLCRFWDFGEGVPGCPRPQRPLGTGTSLSSTGSCFLPSVKLLHWPDESRILLQEVGVYFLNANLVGKCVWLVAMAGLSEYSIMASKIQSKMEMLFPHPPPKHTSGE